MKKIDILKAIAEGHAKLWARKDVLVISLPGLPVRMFRKGAVEYAYACSLVDADLATQTHVPMTAVHIPLVATDKGKQFIAQADRAARRHGHGRTRAGVLA